MTGSLPGEGLVARTRRIDRDVDLLALAGHHGVLFERGRAGLAGRGEAVRLAWPAGDPAAAARTIAEALARIETDDEVGQPGCGPVAFGALPFRPGAATELILPRIVVGRAEDGTRWLTTISSTRSVGRAGAEAAPDPSGHPHPVGAAPAGQTGVDRIAGSGDGPPAAGDASSDRTGDAGGAVPYGSDVDHAPDAAANGPAGHAGAAGSAHRQVDGLVDPRPGGPAPSGIMSDAPSGSTVGPAAAGLVRCEGAGAVEDPLAEVLDEVAAGRLTADDGDELLRRLGAGPAGGGHERLPLPRRFTVESTMDPDEWCALVERATKVLANPSWSGGPGTGSGPLDPVGSASPAGPAGPARPGGGALSKVVLARELLVTADRPLDRRAVLARLRAGYPGCHVVSVDGFIGASPELLVSRSGDVVRSHPMAGTAPRGGDPTTDQRLAASLLASTKDRAEHQITIDMVHDTLLGWCSYLDYEAEPSVVAVANVQHLATLVEGRLSRPAPSVLELVAALHPTPAVAGWPRDEAVAWIAAHEGFDRGRYAGTVGWADGRGNGTWAVAVRCAELDGHVARVFAGTGVVADSDPQAELAETHAKLQALLSALVRP